MRENRFRSLLASRTPATLAWCTSAHPLTVETLAHAGFDAVALDMQHGAVTAGELLTALQAVSTSAATPIVRVPWNEPAAIMKALDLGAYGIICPMIETVADVEQFVAACRYPPQGMRSYGPTRARLYAGSDYAAPANATVLAIAMIETRAAMENLDAILAVPGLDAVFVGPADLSQAFGGPPGADWEEGVVPPLLERIVSAAAAAGVPAGIFTRSPEYAARMVARGFAFATIDSDIGYLEQGAARALRSFAAARDGLARGSS
jgi:4-hydroxy-2-oxoheptanedioate aldolase